MLLKRPSELEAPPAMRALPRPLVCVAEHVVLQVRRVLVRLPTSFTGEWPLPRMHALMSLHVPNLRECFSADLTAEWTFSGVYAQMAPQHLRSRKRLVTKGAWDLESGSLMVALVLFQVEHVDEGLAADGAQMLALTCMITFVSSKEAGIDEALPALITLIRALHGMVADVNGQLKCSREAFVTMRTLVQVL